MRILFIIGAGGFLGTMARYLVQQGVSKMLPIVFPYGTLIVNIAGCFLIGVFYTLTSKENAFTPDWRLFLTTGFCGGFTTFSTFTYETYNLFREEQYLYLSIYVAASIILSILATFAGMALMRQ